MISLSSQYYQMITPAQRKMWLISVFFHIIFRIDGYGNSQHAGFLGIWWSEISDLG